MSYNLGINTLRLIPGERLAHTEYCDHYALVRALSGLDPLKDPLAWRKFYDAWQLDFLWVTNEGPLGWDKRGRITDMGHAEFMEGGIDRRDTIYCPFKDAEDVLHFDAVEEYGLINFDDLVPYYENLYQSGRKDCPEQVSTGGYYNTIVSGAIQAFGWDMFLEAAADYRRFDKVLESFYRQTLHHVNAWSKTTIEVFIQHDDMVWTRGAFMKPDFYRRAIFPRYQKLWKVLHDAGKIVLFCSDGNFTEFVDDLAAAGADGFIFEPLTDLDYIISKYGQTKVIMGSKVDCRTLTFRKRDQIKHEVDETLKIAKACPGFVFAVGNHLPINIPLDNALYYFDYLNQNWWR
jgi:hypothetical protein